LVFAVAVSATTAVACAFFPMLRIQRGSLALREARGGTAGRGQHRLRSALVAVQVAMSLVVLSGSALLLRSFERLHAVRLGFDSDQVLSVWTSLPRSRYPRDTALVRFYSTLVDRVSRIPGVQSVGVASRLPLVARGVNQKRAYPERGPRDDSKLPPLEILTTVGGDFFGAMGIPLLAGRPFDRIATQHEGDAIVSRRTAELLWNDSTGTAALGKRFRAVPAGPWYTVIGVVGDAIDTSLAAPPSPIIYFPEIVQRDSITPQTSRTMSLVVRAAVEPTSLAPEVTRLVRELDPTLPTFDVQALSGAVRASTARLSLVILILGGAAIITLLLGAIGLYGVMAYVVTLRRRELGIRIALGASPRRVSATTIRSAVVLTGAGVVVGLALFMVASRFVHKFLFGVSPWDPMSIAGATLVLLAMATVASWIPARRAGRVDPAEALRTE
jgi:predicted permease